MLIGAFGKAVRVKAHTTFEKWPNSFLIFFNLLWILCLQQESLCSVWFFQELSSVPLFPLDFHPWGFLNLDQWGDIFWRLISVTRKDELSWINQAKGGKNKSYKKCPKGFWQNPYSALTSYLTFDKLSNLWEIWFPSLCSGHFLATSSEG